MRAPWHVGALLLAACAGEPTSAGPADDLPFDADAPPPVCADETIGGIIDVHEHVVGADGLEAMLAATAEVGIDRTVAFSMLPGRFEDSARLIAKADELPHRLIPFTTVDVRDPHALGFLKASVAAGARGLKLFSGHGEVHGETPLDAAAAGPIYEYLEQTGTPLLMHVNGPEYGGELERVLDAHPDLVMVCPHLCLYAHRPGRLAALLDAYPNLYVDLSFGKSSAAHMAFMQIGHDIETWRRFVRVYVDRITFGSDTVFVSDNTAVRDREYLRSYLAFVEDETFLYEGREYAGLGADACTAKHILEHNPGRFVEGLPPERAP